MRKQQQAVCNLGPLEQLREPEADALEAAARQIHVFPGRIHGARLIPGNVVEY